MKIENNMSAGALLRSEPSPVVPAQKPVEGDSATFSQANALTLSLRDEPGSRTEEVERALNLVGQVQWPPQTVIRRIASLLAMHISNEL
jgi:hypothetical protein